jgi:hypothetical protein
LASTNLETFLIDVRKRSNVFRLQVGTAILDHVVKLHGRLRDEEEPAAEQLTAAQEPKASAPSGDVAPQDASQPDEPVMVEQPVLRPANETALPDANGKAPS